MRWQSAPCLAWTQKSTPNAALGDPVHIQQSSQTIQNIAEAGDVYVGIAWGADDGSSCCADSLCMEMIFLRDADIAQQWLSADPENREIFTLPEPVEFATQFFVPLLD